MCRAAYLFRQISQAGVFSNREAAAYWSYCVLRTGVLASQVLTSPLIHLLCAHQHQVCCNLKARHTSQAGVFSNREAAAYWGYWVLRTGVLAPQVCCQS